MLLNSYNIQGSSASQRMVSFKISVVMWSRNAPKYTLLSWLPRSQNKIPLQENRFFSFLLLKFFSESNLNCGEKIKNEKKSSRYSNIQHTYVFNFYFFCHDSDLKHVAGCIITTLLFTSPLILSFTGQAHYSRISRRLSPLLFNSNNVYSSKNTNRKFCLLKSFNAGSTTLTNLKKKNPFPLQTNTMNLSNYTC